MKNQINVLENLSEELQKALALKQFNDEDFIICGDKAYEGNEAEELAKFDAGDPVQWSEYCETELIEIAGINGNEEVDGYIVLTDEEADEAAKEYIIESLWAFNASFLASQTGLDEEIFKAIQDNGKCEDNNNTIYNTITKLGDIDEFVSDAISADGRGHFLNTYDGNENEERIGGVTYFIYRIN